jgi:hypothetical protein
MDGFELQKAIEKLEKDYCGGGDCVVAKENLIPPIPEVPLYTLSGIKCPLKPYTSRHLPLSSTIAP